MLIRRIFGLCALSLLATQVGCADPSADTGTDTDIGGTSDTDSDTSGTDATDTEVATDSETETDSGTDTSGEVDFPPVTEPGPYNVGYRNFEVVYTPIGESEARTLEVAAWYPTEATSGAASVYAGLVTREHIWLGAAPTLESDLPVLLFSHGNGGLAEQSYPLTEFFASHGWVVISPNHTGNTIVDIDEALLPKMVVWRPQDMIASYEAIAGEGSQDPLAGKLGEELVVMGHSFGGYTSLVLAGGGFDLEGLDAECETDPESLACTGIDPQLATQLADPRVDVAIPLTPGPAFVFGVEDAGGVADIDVPVMLMTSVLDETTPDNTDGDPIWSSLDGSEDRRVEFLTGGHFTFSIACDFDFITGDGCGDMFIPAQEAFPIAAAYSLAFARTHLWGDASVADLLSGETVLSDEVSLVRP